MTPLTPHTNLFAIEVPENVPNNMRISDNHSNIICYYSIVNGYALPDCYQLPPGNYSILCPYPCTESDAAKVVIKYHLKERFADYVSVPDQDLCAMHLPLFETALESLASLFKSNNLSTEKRYVILKNEQ